MPLTLALSACSYVKNDNPSAPQLMHHSDDNKGSGYFPSQRAATGKKVVIFDPKATAWAAYGANGQRIKTGRASGGKHFCPDVGRGCKTTVGSYRFYSKKVLIVSLVNIRLKQVAGRPCHTVCILMAVTPCMVPIMYQIIMPVMAV